MAGANYMGGRRNAMKARVRDTNGKLQKSHFSKQRMNVLTKGLRKASSTKPSRTSEGPNQMPEISLAHARRPSVASQSHFPNQIQLLPLAYTKALSSADSASVKQASSGTSSSPRAQSVASRSSKILQEIDMTEPLSFRAEVSRLLAHPDFAGLLEDEQEPCTIMSSPASSSAGTHDEVARVIKAGRSPVSSPNVSSGPYEPYADGQNYTYKDFLIEVQDSSPDFDPMPYDEDSGYAEAFPVDTRHSSPSSSEVADSDTGFSRHLRDTPQRVSSVSIGSSLQWRNCSELENRTRSTTTGASCSNSERLSSHFTPDLLKLSDGDLPGSLRNVDFTNDRREPSFLERMVAKYPHVSASVSSGQSYLSRPCYETPPRLCSPFSGVDGSPESMIDIVSRNQSLPEDTNEAEETTLLDAVAGRLFEDSNPWKAIKAHLSGSPMGLESLAATISPTKDAFVELWTAADRRGVGFRNTHPTFLATDSQRASLLDSPESSTENSPLPSICCSANGTRHSEVETYHTPLNPSTPPPFTADLAPQEWDPSAQRQTPVQRRIDRSGTLNTFVLPPLIPSGDSEGRRIGTNDTLAQINASRVSSPAATNRKLHVFATSPTSQEQACLQGISTIKTSPMMSHSSPQDTCIMTSTRMISVLPSASAVLPDNASAGDEVREVQQAHREEEPISTVPIQPSPKETFIVGPSLFDDESEDCDDL